MFSETHLYQFDPPRDKGKYRDTKLTPIGFLGTKKEGIHFKDDNKQQSRELPIMRHMWNHFYVFYNSI